MREKKGKPPSIGCFELQHPLLLAPLAGVTDSAFRRICKEQGAAMVYSEMVSAKGLFYRDKNTDGLLSFHEQEEPVAYQLFGSEPEIMAWAVGELHERRNVLIDVNMGCPVPKVVKNGEGAALMKNPKLAEALITEMVKAEARAAELAGDLPKPITVKCRAGWDLSHRNAVEFALRMQEAGASAVGIHGRTREQYYEGKADWEIIARVKEALEIPVIGSGDVFSAADAVSMLEKTGCDYVMAARGALGNPWIFRDFLRLWGWECAETVPVLPGERLNVIRNHLRLVLDEKGEDRGIREMRKHISWYVKGVYGAAEIRRRVNSMVQAAEVMALLEDFLG